MEWSANSSYSEWVDNLQMVYTFERNLFIECQSVEIGVVGQPKNCRCLYFGTCDLKEELDLIYHTHCYTLVVSVKQVQW